MYILNKVSTLFLRRVENGTNYAMFPIQHYYACQCIKKSQLIAQFNIYVKLYLQIAAHSILNAILENSKLLILKQKYDLSLTKIFCLHLNYIHQVVIAQLLLWYSITWNKFKNKEFTEYWVTHIPDWVNTSKENHPFSCPTLTCTQNTRRIDRALEFCFMIAVAY